MDRPGTSSERSEDHSKNLSTEGMMLNDDYPKDVLDHIADLLSNDPYKDYWNTSAPEAGRNTRALINSETGQTFLVTVEIGKVSRG